MRHRCDAAGLGGAHYVRHAVFYAGDEQRARAWSQRFFAKTGKFPAPSHVAEYEAVAHYLKAVQKAQKQLLLENCYAGAGFESLPSVFDPAPTPLVNLGCVIQLER